MDLVVNQGEPVGGVGVWGSSVAPDVGFCFCPHSSLCGWCWPKPPSTPQTFIDAHSMPGMMPGTRNAKMNETYYLTSGSSQGRGPIADSYEEEGQGAGEGEHSLSR